MDRVVGMRDDELDDDGLNWIDVVDASDDEPDLGDDECGPPHGIVDGDSDGDVPDVALAIAKQKNQRK